MFPGMNPRKMNQMMKKMGVQQVDIPATEVIIKSEGKELVILNPQVSKVNMMGQETIQIVGQIHERELELKLDESDITMIISQTNVSREVATAALKDSKGDLAKAIMDLTSNE